MLFLLFSRPSGLSAAGSAAGQAAANFIDPCNATNPLNAALWGGLGGGIAKAIPTKNLNSWAQAKSFGAKTPGGLVGSPNARTNLAAAGAAAGVAAASNVSKLNPF